MKTIIGTLLTTIILGSIIMIFTGYEYINEQTIECKVEDKWIKRRNEQSDLYLVSCGGTTYKVADLFFKGKFNSSDIYGRLKIGEEYKLKVTGYRIPILSEYQNINKIEE